MREQGFIYLLDFSTNSFTRKENQVVEGKYPKVPAHHTRDAQIQERDRTKRHEISF